MDNGKVNPVSYVLSVLAKARANQAFVGSNEVSWIEGSLDLSNESNSIGYLS